LGSRGQGPPDRDGCRVQRRRIAWAMAPSGLASVALFGLGLCGLLGIKLGYDYAAGAPLPRRAAAGAAAGRRLVPSTEPSAAAAKDLPGAAHARSLGVQWEPFVNGTKVLGPAEKFNQTPGELVVVVSEPQSGSMSLTMELSRRHLCLYDCNELLGDIPAIPCRHAVWHENWRDRKRLALDVTREARDKLCSTRMPKCWHNPNVPADVVRQCWRGCSTASYLFHEHEVHGKKLLELLWFRGTRVIVLERDPSMRKCSMDKNNGVLAKTAPCPAQAPANFTKLHKQWYGEVRYYLEKNDIPRLEISFDAYMKDREKVMSSIKEFAGM